MFLGVAILKWAWLVIWQKVRCNHQKSSFYPGTVTVKEKLSAKQNEKTNKINNSDINFIYHGTKTTWAQSRNILLENALKLGWNYEYFIFMDIDMLNQIINFELETWQVVSNARTHSRSPMISSDSSLDLKRSAVGPDASQRHEHALRSDSSPPT